jgi:hypothetical protein
MSEDSFLSKLLESIENLNLPEGEYLEACNLMKTCHKSKEKWVSATKNFEKRIGANIYNKKGLCLSLTLNKVVFYKPNHNEVEFAKKPDDVYTFIITSKGFEKNLSKTSNEIFSFFENLISLYSIINYDIIMEDEITISEEIYDFIENAKKHLKKIEELNGDEDEEDEFYMDEDNFYKHAAFDIKKIFSFAVNL